MATVTLNTLNIPNYPSMAMPLNILNWLDASFSGVGKVFLRSFSYVTATNPYETLLFKGTNLSITADDGPNIIADGQPLSARTGTGIITEFTYGYSTTASFAYYPYTISGLSINVADFLSHGGDVLTYVLSGADVIIGTRHAEVLMGYGGDDVLRPGMADNAVPATRDFPGALHSDVVDGGAGNDTVSFEGITIDLSINLATHSAIDRQPLVGPNAMLQVHSTLISIENATGGDGHDLLVGDAQINILNGGNGNDNIYGGAGNDILLGGIGNDILRGDAGADIINGGEGSDRTDYTTSTVGVTVNLANGTASDGDTLISIENIYGSAHNDALVGSDAANVLYGYNGDDQLFGLGGNDNLNGQAGDDALHGGDGIDIVSGGDGNDGLFGDAGNDRLIGGNGNDFLDGGLGNDTLLDDAGNDQLYGGAGNDIFTLGAGNDYFSLGAGDDRVMFVTGNGNDTIGDFHNGHDVIDFVGSGVTLASLQAHAVETSQGAMLVFGTDSILLAGVHLPQINWAADFVFSV
jgi:Ca2+-binding RTX toxin-like protein